MHRQQAQSLGKFLQKGIQEGMFSSNIDLSLAAEVFIAQSSIIMKEMGASNDIDTVGKMIDTAFIIFLRGVATQKGIEIIDDFFKENNI